MSPTFEHIKKEIRMLPPAERLSLWRELLAEFDCPVGKDETEEAVDAAWDEEIARRVTEIEDGTVKLLSAEEVEKCQDVLFAELGLVRKPHTA